MSDTQGLCDLLRALSKFEHSDVSIGDDAADEIERLERENAELRKVCAEAYQVAGCAGAPVRVLDNLSCAANNRPIPHETMLPVLLEEFDEVAELRKKLEQAHAALNIADDFLRVHWDMQTVPLIEISAAIAATEPPK